ncbi:MAG: hypothetical protein HY914_14520 [Desulfomonile tiedjei]|nr:hypothetical protein [Desulfomonile tiedjei]
MNFITVFLSMNEHHNCDALFNRLLGGQDNGLDRDSMNAAIANQIPAELATDDWKLRGKRDYGPRERQLRHDFLTPEGLKMPKEHAEELVRASIRSLLRKNKALLPAGTKWIEITVDMAKWERLTELAKTDPKAYRTFPLGLLAKEVHRQLSGLSYEAKRLRFPTWEPPARTDIIVQIPLANGLDAALGDVPEPARWLERIIAEMEV